jgi:DNA-binding response OmpR family regulator
MNKKKILIIEDDSVMQNALQEYLSGEGFEIACAVDGEMGERMAKSEKPDLVLLDIVIPKKDGYEVLAEIKKNEETKDIPVILLTNLGSIEDIEKALNMGATNYLVKADYKLEEVASKIKEVLKI